MFACLYVGGEKGYTDILCKNYKGLNKSHQTKSPPLRPPGVYSFGLFTTTIFANAGQVVTGNQTPHFLSACKPNYTALGCQSPLQYISERRACTGNPYLVASARKSFPSKDAALSFYSAVYTVVRTKVCAGRKLGYAVGGLRSDRKLVNTSCSTQGSEASEKQASVRSCRK